MRTDLTYMFLVVTETGAPEGTTWELHRQQELPAVLPKEQIITQHQVLQSTNSRDMKPGCNVLLNISVMKCFPVASFDSQL